MDSKKRGKISWGGSVLLHILIVLMLAFTGILHSQQLKEDIVEIAFVGGSGGNDGGASDNEPVEQATAGAEETPLQKELPSADAIIEKKTAAVQPAFQHSAVGKQPAAAAPGSGKGHGTGSGGSNGSGSGTGSGSGNGSGSGTGSGPGNGAAANPAIPPRIIKSLRPVYPAAEKTAHIEGTVLLRLLITAEGTVSNVDVLTSSGSQNLDLAARQACLKWRFSAARNSQGQQISCYANIPVTFKIKT